VGHLAAEALVQRRPSPIRLLALDRKNPVEWMSVLELVGLGLAEIGRAWGSGRTPPA
jgi:hypothetical protein